MSQNLRPDLGASNQQSMSHTRSTSLSADQTSDALEIVETDEFLEDMLLVVAYSFSASSYQPSPGEKMRTAKIWARLLRPIIPGDRLMDVFDECFAEHDNSRPLNAYDLKNKYQQNAKNESEKAAKIEAQEKVENAPAHCPVKNLHRAEDDAVQEYGVMDKWKVSKFYWLPCHVCRPQAHMRKQGEIIAGNPELAGPNTILQDVAKVAAKTAFEGADLSQKAQDSLGKILNMSDRVYLVRDDEGETDAA